MTEEKGDMSGLKKNYLVLVTGLKNFGYIRRKIFFFSLFFITGFSVLPLYVANTYCSEKEIWLVDRKFMTQHQW